MSIHMSQNKIISENGHKNIQTRFNYCTLLLLCFKNPNVWPPYALYMYCLTPVINDYLLNPYDVHISQKILLSSWQQPSFLFVHRFREFAIIYWRNIRIWGMPNSEVKSWEKIVILQGSHQLLWMMKKTPHDVSTS